MSSPVLKGSGSQQEPKVKEGEGEEEEEEEEEGETERGRGWTVVSHEIRATLVDQALNHSFMDCVCGQMGRVEHSLT